jgi:protein-L-isoaspartate(D-aspartate) O-methyltransferase
MLALVVCAATVAVTVDPAADASDPSEVDAAGAGDSIRGESEEASVGVAPVPVDPIERAYEIQRHQLVEHALVGSIRDERVLDAMRKVPRHRFVPPPYRKNAYDDHPLPIGEGQTISQPYIVAKMTELLELTPDSRVLEIGTGSGYQAAVLAELAGEVYSIEIVEPLGRRAAGVLEDLGYGDIHLRIGDGYRGWPEAAPFDAIIVTCAPERVPDPLQKQLAEGGRLVIPVGSQFWGQELVLIRKRRGELVRQDLLPVRFVPMTGEGVKSGAKRSDPDE